MHMELLDLAVSSLHIIAYLVLLVGVYPFNNKAETSSFLKHGLISIISLGINFATIFLVMLPEFGEIASTSSMAGMAERPVMWIHAIIGLITLVSALLIVGFWFSEPLGELGCAKRWRFMKPTFVVWGLAVASGIILVLFEFV
jgi:hypothetical protein